MSIAELDDYRVILFGWTWRQRDQDGLACFRPLPGQRIIHRVATRARLVDQPSKIIDNALVGFCKAEIGGTAPRVRGGREHPLRVTQ